VVYFAANHRFNQEQSAAGADLFQAILW